MDKDTALDSICGPGTANALTTLAALPAVRRRVSKKLPAIAWDLFWSPEGKKIATVTAVTYHDAIRKAPMPYRKYLGEIYALEA